MGTQSSRLKASSQLRLLSQVCVRLFPLLIVPSLVILSPVPHLSAIIKDPVASYVAPAERRLNYHTLPGILDQLVDMKAHNSPAITSLGSRKRTNDSLPPESGGEWIRNVLGKCRRVSSLWESPAPCQPRSAAEDRPRPHGLRVNGQM
ncbi:hypothetical protein NQZ68_029386 [Dissostichus eleginoides]|nr:hypothetical protein NQZ68_029386 [Dissostichus eleginoides]